VGDGISSEFNLLLRERKLLKARITRQMIVKEITAAETNLDDNRDSLERNKFKWATIQAYYSMFHSARALLYHRGYRERSHHAMPVALRELFSRELGSDLISQFEAGMDLKREADYGLKFSETEALETIEGAEKLLAKARDVLGMKR
jgi:uncharacterized protein (UPF0332 family)